MASYPRIIDPELYLQYCSLGTEANIPPEDRDYKGLCNEAKGWSQEKCPEEIDPLSQEPIPPEYLIKIRSRVSDNKSILGCRDIRWLLDHITYSSGGTVIDPGFQLPYTASQVKRILNNPYTQTIEFKEAKKKIIHGKDREKQLALKSKIYCDCKPPGCLRSTPIENSYCRVDPRCDGATRGWLGPWRYCAPENE